MCLRQRYVVVLGLVLIFIGGVQGCSHVSSSVHTVKKPLPIKLTTSVTDDAHVLSEDTQQTLTEMLQRIEKKTTAEIAILTIPSLNGNALEGTATQLFNATGIGKKGKNNGILIMVVTQDHKVRLEVGLGLESTISDKKAGRLLDQYAIPNFKQGNYGDGLIAVVDAISKILQKNTHHGSH